MKKNVLLFALLIGGMLLQAQDAQTVISKYLKVSGQEKMAKTECIVAKGVISMPMMGMEMPFTITKARPSYLHMESEFAGSKMVQTYNGETGWIYAPGIGIAEAREFTEDELKAIVSQVKMDFPLSDYMSNIEQIQLVGEEKFNNKDCFHIQFKSGDENVTDYFINKDSYLLEGLTSTQDANGQKINVTTSFSEYKKVKGIMQSFVATNKMEGQILSIIKTEEITYSKTPDQAFFGKPANE